MLSLGNPFIGDEEIESVSELLADGTLSLGTVVSTFENEFATFTDRAGGAAVASGSVALEMGLQAAGFDSGAGIVVSPYNCGAMLYSLLREDLVPVFADIDPETCNLDPAAVREAIRDSEEPVEGLLITHLYGLPADFDALADIAAEFELTVINDFAQAPGATYKNKQIGSLGEIGVCSFGATKNITTAEGGMVVSDDKNIIQQVQTLRSNTGSHTTESQRSVRMNDLEAAIGREQLDKYDEILRRKNRIASIYRDGLPSEIILQPELSDRTDVYHGFPIRLADRDKLASHLADENIMTAAVYDTPLYEYEACPESVDPTVFEHTAEVSATVLLLPIHAYVTAEQAACVVNHITEFVG